MIILSIQNVFRTVLILIGVFMLLRFFGRLMIAKRNLEEQDKLRRQQKESEELIEQSKANHGKSFISKIGKSESSQGEFVDFEEINDD